jgi:monoterpene epsilon-lactone hydrolase
MSDSHPTLHVPARDIPIPSSVSAEAQAVMGAPPMATPELPELDDLDGWRASIRAHDGAIAALMADQLANAPVTTSELDLGDFRVHEITPDELPEDDDNVYLDIHGGAFVYGGGESCAAMSTGTATRNAARVWSVDYRMPPDHPFPAGLDDCLVTYRKLLQDRSPDQIIVGGASAGGNLAAALILRARDEGLPLPAAAVLMTPAVDLTESGDSLQTNLGLDPLLTSASTPTFKLYVGTHDVTNPYISPLYGDFTRGFPATILTTGTRDMLLSDTVRLHRALRAGGIAAELHVQEAAGHGGFFGMAPEDQEIIGEVRRFLDDKWHRSAD